MDSPVIELAKLDAASLRELIEGLIAANKALALKVDGLERAVEVLKKPAGLPDYLKHWPLGREPKVTYGDPPCVTGGAGTVGIWRGTDGVPYWLVQN